MPGVKYSIGEKNGLILAMFAFIEKSRGEKKSWEQKKMHRRGRQIGLVRPSYTRAGVDFWVKISSHLNWPK